MGINPYGLVQLCANQLTIVLCEALGFLRDGCSIPFDRHRQDFSPIDSGYLLVANEEHMGLPLKTLHQHLQHYIPGLCQNSIGIIFSINQLEQLVALLNNNSIQPLESCSFAYT